VPEKAPNKYKSILTAEQRNKGAKLSLTDLNNCMNDLFLTMNPNRADPKEDTEVALLAASTKLKGICRNSKKPGHMAKDCRLKKTNEENSKTLRPCRHCGGKHMDTKCWELPHNAMFRPKNWTSRNITESANVACDVDTGPQIELLLSDQDPHSFSHQQDMLLQPFIWIGDTVATMFGCSFSPSHADLDAIDHKLIPVYISNGLLQEHYYCGCHGWMIAW
jgi:hypothetical protein